MSEPITIPLVVRGHDSQANGVVVTDAKMVELKCRECDATEFHCTYSGHAWYRVSVFANHEREWKARRTEGDTEVGDDFEQGEEWECSENCHIAKDDLNLAIGVYCDWLEMGPEAAAREMATDLAIVEEWQREHP